MTWPIIRIWLRFAVQTIVLWAGVVAASYSSWAEAATCFSLLACLMLAGREQ